VTKRICPTCSTPACRVCGGRKCKCDPKSMEIAIYCNCPPIDFLEFMRKQLDLPQSEIDRIHEASKKNLKKWLMKNGHLDKIFDTLRDEGHFNKKTEPDEEE